MARHEHSCRDMLEAGEALVAKASDVGAIVLECSNRAPYARAPVDHLSLPVFDILSLLAWWHRSLSPRFGSACCR